MKGGVLRADRTSFTPSKELAIQLFARYQRVALIWKNPAFHARPDGAVRSAYPPSSALAQSLRQAVEARYGKHMTVYNIVPYKDRFFAATEGNQKSATWECIGGRWSFIFEHGDTSEVELDRLYAKNGFSSKMRKRLLEGDWDFWR